MTKKNFISADFRTAITSHGEELNVGDNVRHDDKTAGEAIITGFTFDPASNEITAFTTEGFAHIDFIHKI